MNIKLYDKVSFLISKQITNQYSTSFSLATRMFDKEEREAIYNIYGFVRVADEIVDTFHEYDKEELLLKFEKDFYESIKSGVSTNPILHSFQFTVRKYEIPQDLIAAFLSSMKNDLTCKDYSNKDEINKYIYGSAEVVGLMCLKVFCKSDNTLFNDLIEPAKKLGSAFQKVNFLRDIKFDNESLGRNYFNSKGVDEFSEGLKLKEVHEVESEFRDALYGIKKLPGRSKLAVMVAYYYYLGLLNKIKRTPSDQLISKRVRLSNLKKLLLLIKASALYKFRVI